MNNLLARHNIYTIPAGDYFELPPQSCFLVYAPLANTFFLATPENIDELEQQLAQGRTNDSPVWETLLKRPDNFHILERKPAADELVTLYLILNERCNFACKYCYSAQGRSGDELNMATIRPMVDCIVDNARRLKARPFIMFVGGGEPTLSWPLVESTVSYATQQWNDSAQPIRWAISTNGSILTEDMIAFYKKHAFEVQCSFEVLPDVQNKQRGSFDKVSANLRRLSAEGIHVRVRSTITQLNVNRLDEMVRFCQQNYPQVQTLACEPVVDCTFLTTPEAANQFLDSYYKSFIKARAEARKTKMTFVSSCAGSISSLRNHFCGNFYCLTPFGSITPCPNTSSPREEGYEEHIYGHVIDGKPVLDNAAYQKLIRNGEEYSECGECFARWNCAGGCPNQRRVYSPEVFACICKHMRRMVRQSLLERLEQRYREDTGTDFRQAMHRALTESSSH